MTYMVNQLNASQVERLVMIAEEACEVAMECCKALRHGLDSWHPGDPECMPNSERINREFIDLMAMMEYAAYCGDIPRASGGQLAELTVKAMAKKQRYAHHQGDGLIRAASLIAEHLPEASAKTAAHFNAPTDIGK